MLKNRLNKLYIDKLDGVIDDDLYKEKKLEFQNELDNLEIQNKNFINETDTLVDMATQIIELCKNAYSLYYRSNNENKRLLINLLCSNFLYDGENVVIELKNTLKPMLLGVNFKNGGG